MGIGKTIASVQPGTRVLDWKMKVIRSLTRKIKAYELGYSKEDYDCIPGATMQVEGGKSHVCKNGKKSVRPLKRNKTKKDYSADESFDRRLADEEGIATGSGEEAQEGSCEDGERRLGPTAERSRHHVDDTIPRVAEPQGCPQVVDRTLGESAAAGSDEEKLKRSRPGAEADKIMGSTEGVAVDDRGRAESVEIMNHWGYTGKTPMARMNIADRKRARKARDQARREIAHGAATAYQELVDKHSRDMSSFMNCLQGYPRLNKPRIRVLG